jgi:hypothetical protein
MQIRPDGTVAATNGHSALIVRDGSPFPDSDFPSGDARGTGRLAPFKGNPATPILLSGERAASLIKVMPKRATIPILAAVQMSTNGDEGGAVFSATDLSAAVVAHVPADQAVGNFPALDKVWPADKRPEVSLTLTVDMLEDLITAAKAIHPDKGVRGITFGIPISKPNVDAERHVISAVRVTMASGGLSIDGVVMPCRL